MIVGTNHQIEAVADALERAESSRIKPVGFISLEPRAENGLRDLGSIDSIEDHFDEIDEVIIADPTSRPTQAVDLVDRCHRGGVTCASRRRTMDILRRRRRRVRPGRDAAAVRAEAAGLRGRRLRRQARLRHRRLGPAAAAALAAADRGRAAVKLTSKRPGALPSPRPGPRRRVVRLPQVPHDDTNADTLQEELEELNEADGAIFKIREDPRLTPVGGFLRRWSLDELPQLINVLLGEMRLVGPRPLPHRDYERLEDWHKKRYLVLPGLTGLWQVSGRQELRVRRPGAPRLPLHRALERLPGRRDHAAHHSRRSCASTARTSPPLATGGQKVADLRPTCKPGADRSHAICDLPAKDLARRG